MIAAFTSTKNNSLSLETLYHLFWGQGEDDLPELLIKLLPDFFLSLS